ncbi:MAG: PQQ-binding-like beta-propeller repeat protein [Candidatus Bathyarchaeota archaeon]|nr:PQQ-binding-like beta-propeller repeat protein [Candidatus Bathyarchaeum sp.]
MKKTEHHHAIVALLLVSLLILSSFIMISNPLSVIANASNTVDEYDDLLQYEWTQIHGDSGFTRYAEGPAPEAADILWKATVKGIKSYLTAFNGKVLVTTKTNVIALDKDTGAVIWNTSFPESQNWPEIYKIDEIHLVVGSSCFDIETGNIIWTSNEFASSSAPLFVINCYSEEEKMFYTKVESYIQGWNFSDPSVLPTLEWTTYVPGGGAVGSGIQYGEGKVFPGSFESHQIALDAKTGDVIWDTETKGAMLFSGAYYEGMFFRGGTHDNSLYCFNATDGEILWTYNANTEDGYFCVGPAVAYGMVYMLNKDGHLYALDVYTGDVVWKYKGPGSLMFPGSPTVADGKVYATTGQAESYTTEYGESEFACLDAYTGEVIWKLEMESFAPRESVVIAYGTLYFIPGNVTTAVDSISGDEYTTIDEVWAIRSDSWSMWRHDAEHTAAGQSGPAELTLRWKFTTGGSVVSSPTIVDGRAYFGSQDKNVYCIDARNSRLIWKFTTEARLKSTPAVVNGKVYIGPDDGYIYCLDAYNGSLIWKTYAGGYIEANFAATVLLRSSPAVVDGNVYVGSLDTNVYCLDAESGEVKWKTKTDGVITSSPSVVDGAVYIVSQESSSGGLYKLDANNGNVIWKKSIPYQVLFMGGTDVHASPTVAEGMVFASSNSKEYYGINATTSETEWIYTCVGAEEFILCSTIYNEGNLFLIDKFSIVCVDAKNGNAIWSTYLGDELYVSPSYADGKLYVATDQRSIYVLNATNGEKLGYFGTSSNTWSAPTIYEGRVYVGNNDWNVYCLDDTQVTYGQISVELNKYEVKQGESVTGSGQITPEIGYVPITVFFTKSDGVVDCIEVTARNDGAFSFTYVPDVTGECHVSVWCSGASYIMDSADMTLKVVGSQQLTSEQQTDYATAAGVILIIAVIVVAAYLFIKKRNKSAQVLIS